jgi:CDGSH-type Zn-finger protein/uncharacterized Fe-S cluster protein YjdI
MSEPVIVVEHRAMLGYLLTEAAEIEHGLMCCYLYAAFSLKDATDGLSPEQDAAIGRIRQSILSIARDEMTHLALVNNLLNALGYGPYWGRPNFPVQPGYHPSAIVVALAPFDRATLEHFLFLERPEGVDVPDGAGFASATPYQRRQSSGRLVPSAQDYETVGHLYRGIRSGLEAMTARWGEAKVFCGDPRLQVGDDVFSLAGMSTVTDLASALRALDTIVTQGEGSPGHAEESHYERFRAIERELSALERADPSFVPARAAARNPLMRRPPDETNRVFIQREPAAALLDLGNAIYAFSLRALDALFGHPNEWPAAREVVADASLLPMRALGAIGRALTRLPATADDAGPRAGLTFTMTRTPGLVADPARELALLAEAARALVRGYDAVAVPIDAAFAAGRDLFAALALRLDAVSEQLRAQDARPLASPVVAPSAGPSAPVRLPVVDSSVEGLEVVAGTNIELRFEAKRCIHARHCVLETPEVFLANVQGPWIHPDDAPIDRLTHVARTCPSGAITFRRLDGGEEEAAPPVNLVRVREAGPLAIHGDLQIAGQAPTFRATLCRCGASKNKPFCDGSHAAAGFTASGEPVTVPTEPLAVRGGPLAVTPLANGPLRVSGPLEVLSGTGRTVRRLTMAKLCRCGGSANKPYCDGTHARIGFEAPGE